MKIAVLFDGAGLARLGLEQAGHKCVGVELDEWKHHLSKQVGSGNCILADALTFDLSGFDAVWASPPCMERSSARTSSTPTISRTLKYGTDNVKWCLDKSEEDYTKQAFWIECTLSNTHGNDWGIKWNAAQFLEPPTQNRQRIIGGYYSYPMVYRDFKPHYQHEKLFLCPAVTATEYSGCATDSRRASRYYGRKLNLEDCAYQQGFSIPEAWFEPPFIWPGTEKQWERNLYEAIGNGVPVYMAKAFGRAYKP